MNKSFYMNNRCRLIESIKDEKCMIILSSGYEINRSADENYDFQVNNNFYYLTGIKQPETYLVLLKDGNTYSEVLYIAAYDEYHEKWLGHQITKKEAKFISGIYVSNIDYKDNFEVSIDNFINEYKTVYLDLETNDNINHNSFGLSFKDYLIVNNQDLEIKDIYENIIRLRTSKQPCEIKAFKEAIKTTNLGIQNLMRNAKAGMYEYQLEAYFDFTIKQNGNKPVSFKTIAAGGKNATTLHYSANNCILKDNELVLFDLGCKDSLYCADITRTFPVNGKFTPLQKTIYNIVLKTNKKIAKVAHAGMTLKELQAICVEELANGCLKAKLIDKKEDIKKHYYHGVSHHIGLDTHDPNMRQEPLVVNSIISNEPGLYFPEYNIGIRIEDDLLIKEDRAINLSKDIIKSIEDIENFMSK